MFDKAVNNFLSALKFAPDWFVTSKMIKKLHNALSADDGILSFDEDSGDFTFSSWEKLAELIKMLLSYFYSIWFGGSQTFCPQTSQLKIESNLHIL